MKAFKKEQVERQTSVRQEIKRRLGELENTDSLLMLINTIEMNQVRVLVNERLDEKFLLEEIERRLDDEINTLGLSDFLTIRNRPVLLEGEAEKIKDKYTPERLIDFQIRRKMKQTDFDWRKIGRAALGKLTEQEHTEVPLTHEKSEPRSWVKKFLRGL